MDRHVVVGVVVGVDAIDMPCMPVWIEALYKLQRVTIGCVVLAVVLDVIATHVTRMPVNGG
jgi:hypothetical protein